MISSVLNGGAAAAGVPAGRLVDRVGERLVMGYGALATGAVSLGLLGAGSFGLVLLVSLAIGFLSTVSVPAGGVLVARWFARHERGMAMGVRQTGVPLGGALAVGSHD
jgi:sugar phosphate permease